MFNLLRWIHPSMTNRKLLKSIKWSLYEFFSSNIPLADDDKILSRAKRTDGQSMTHSFCYHISSTRKWINRSNRWETIFNYSATIGIISNYTFFFEIGYKKCYLNMSMKWWYVFFMFFVVVETIIKLQRPLIKDRSEQSVSQRHRGVWISTRMVKMFSKGKSKINDGSRSWFVYRKLLLSFIVRNNNSESMFQQVFKLFLFLKPVWTILICCLLKKREHVVDNNLEIQRVNFNTFWWRFSKYDLNRSMQIIS